MPDEEEDDVIEKTRGGDEDGEANGCGSASAAVGEVG